MFLRQNVRPLIKARVDITIANYHSYKKKKKKNIYVTDFGKILQRVPAVAYLGEERERVIYPGSKFQTNKQLGKNVDSVCYIFNIYFN